VNKPGVRGGGIDKRHRLGMVDSEKNESKEPDGRKAKKGAFTGKQYQRFTITRGRKDLRFERIAAPSGGQKKKTRAGQTGTLRARAGKIKDFHLEHGRGREGVGIREKGESSGRVWG